MDLSELNSIQATGKSVDEAIFKGLQQMGTSIDEVSIEIIQTETKGILGIGAKPAIVRLTQRVMEEFDVPEYMRRAERPEKNRNKFDRRDDRRREKEERAKEVKPAKQFDRKPEKPAKAEKPVNQAAPEKPEKPVFEKPVKAEPAAKQPAEKPVFEKPARPERPERPAKAEKPVYEKPAEKPSFEKPAFEKPAEKAERKPISERPAGVALYGKIEDLSMIPGISAEKAEEDFENEIRERRERNERRNKRDRRERTRGDRPRAERPVRREEADLEEDIPAQEPAEPAKVINYTLEAAEGNPAAEFVTGLIEHMGATGQVLAAQDEDCLRLRIDSEMMGMLIGHRGETLDAMQYLTGLVINKNRKTEGYTRVTLNTEEYREKREETLKRLARKVAGQVRATGRARALEPMNPYERRVLHSALQNNPDVTTHSEGEEPNRRVIVTPRRRSGYVRGRNYRRSAKRINDSYNASSAENSVENIVENNENSGAPAAVIEE